MLWNDKKSQIEDIGALLLGDSEHVNSNQPCRVVICTIVLQEEHTWMSGSDIIVALGSIISICTTTVKVMC